MQEPTVAGTLPVAIVTGGSAGIGRATAVELGSDHRVVVVGRRREPLEAVARR